MYFVINDFFYLGYNCVYLGYMYIFVIEYNYAIY